MRNAWPVRHVVGVPVHALAMREVLSVAQDTIARRGRLLIGVVNAAKIVNMRHDKALSDAVLAADMVLADGTAVVWASRVLRQALPERVAGIDLMTELLTLGSERGYRVYCLGATEQVLAAVRDIIAARYPGVVLAGAHHGYFTDQDEPRVVEDIRAARPDMLFAAMSSPKKEMFLAHWSDRLGVPICHGVGGAFDVLAGKVRRAPPLWQRLGLEWLYRVRQEPLRLWRRYLVTNTLFCAMVLRGVFGRHGPFRAPSPM